MAWIKIIDEQHTTGLVKQIYDTINSRPTATRPAPQITEIISVFSIRPELLRARHAFSQATTFGGSGLGRYREELIAVSVSATLNCKF